MENLTNGLLIEMFQFCFVLTKFWPKNSKWNVIKNLAQFRSWLYLIILCLIDVGI